jgi:hypothetical protein
MGCIWAERDMEVERRAAAKNLSILSMVMGKMVRF